MVVALVGATVMFRLVVVEVVRVAVVASSSFSTEAQPMPRFKVASPMRVNKSDFFMFCFRLFNSDYAG